MIELNMYEIKSDITDNSYRVVVYFDNLKRIIDNSILLKLIVRIRDRVFLIDDQIIGSVKIIYNENHKR